MCLLSYKDWLTAWGYLEASTLSEWKKFFFPLSTCPSLYTQRCKCLASRRSDITQAHVHWHTLLRWRHYKPRYRANKISDLQSWYRAASCLVRFWLGADLFVVVIRCGLVHQWWQGLAVSFPWPSRVSHRTHSSTKLVNQQQANALEHNTHTNIHKIRWYQSEYWNIY